MIALGPIFNLLAVLGSAILLVNLELDHTTRTFTLLFGWMLVNGYLVFGSLPPQTILYRGTTHTNDGRLFLDTLFYTRLEIETIVDYANLSRNFSEEAQLAVSLITSDLLAKCDTDPATPAYLWFAVLRLSHEKDPRHPEYLVRLVQRSDLPLENKTMAIDQFLTDQLHSGPPPDPALTDRLSTLLLASTDTVTTRGTRGSVLIDLGRIEEGKAMLHEVLEKTSNDIDRTYSHIFLALAAKHEGNLELAREHAQTAAKIDPHSLALPRVSNLLSSPVTART